MTSTDDIKNRLSNVRTLEDIVGILSILFNNMNTISRNYYDIFLNDTPMKVPVKLYDDNGVIQNREIPNVASFKTTAKYGTINPEDAISGNIGDLYINIANEAQDLFFKASSTAPTEGWVQVVDSNNNYLKSDGSASNLTDLNMDATSAGTLAVSFGGTGTQGLTGLVKGNGTSPYTSALEGTDYISPNNLRGTCSYYAGYVEDAGDGEKEPLPGWLVCNGAELSQEGKYNKLYQVIGDKYGVASEGKFKLPNLLGSYLKGGSIDAEGENSVVEATVGGHTHGLTGSTGLAGEHAHGRGSMDIAGVAGVSGRSGTSNLPYQMKGCFFKISKGQRYEWERVPTSNPPRIVEDKEAKYLGVNDDSSSYNDPGMGFQASLNWTGETSSEGSHSHSLENLLTADNNPGVENDVKHLVMIPIIKY